MHAKTLFVFCYQTELICVSGLFRSTFFLRLGIIEQFQKKKGKKTIKVAELTAWLNNGHEAFALC